MKNLDKAINSLKLEDLKASEPEKKSSLIEPTEAEIKSIVVLLKEGKSYGEIKKAVRRVEKKNDKQVSAKGFSFGQIREIDLKREAKINELSPKPDVSLDK